MTSFFFFNYYFRAYKFVLPVLSWRWSLFVWRFLRSVGILKRLDWHVQVVPFLFPEHEHVPALQLAVLLFSQEPLLLLLTLLHQAAAIIFEPWNKMHKLSVFSLWSGLVPIVSCRKCLSKWTKRTSSYAASPRWRMDPTPRTSCWSCGPSPSSSLDTRKVSTSVLLAHTLLLLLFLLLWYSTVLFSWADSLCSCQWVTSVLLCIFEYPPKCTCGAVLLMRGWCHVKPLMSCASVYCVCLSLIPL